MDYFEQVLALSRLALGGDRKRVEEQLTRLRDALESTSPDQASKLTRLLTRSERRQELAPMSLERMRAGNGSSKMLLPGEKLTRSTPLPADKETGAPLVRVVFPDDRAEAEPVLNPELKSAIDDLLREWDNINALHKIGVRPNSRCLIYGPPGVGKTLLARYIAKRLDLPMLEARLDGLISSFLGTTARNIGALFDFADRYRCILFLDEFDAVAKARDDSHEVGEIKRVVNTLLQCLDARSAHGFTLAATNHEHLLDAAVWRRFEARIHISLPDQTARTEILTRYLDPVRLPEPEMRLLIWLSEGISGADLETLVSGGKRYLVLHDGERGKRWDSAEISKALLAALRRQATLNAKVFDARRRKLLLGPEKLLANALIEEAGFTQKEAASLLGVHQSTVSRRRKKPVSNGVDIGEEAH